MKVGCGNLYRDDYSSGYFHRPDSAFYAPQTNVAPSVIVDFHTGHHDGNAISR
jgi:hypothetical protein